MKTYLPMTKPGALCYSLTLLLAAAQAACAGGVVTNNTEAALRAALAGGGLVTFGVSGKIVLTGTLTITNATTIDASGHSVILDGNNAVRLFNVNTGAALTLKDLTLTHGNHVGTSGGKNTNGASGLGGAAFVDQGELTALGCRFWTNSATGGAGGPGNVRAPGDNGGNGGGGSVERST